MTTSVAIFSWNTQSLIITSTNNYIREIHSRLTRCNPDLLVIGLQEDNINESDFIWVFTNLSLGVYDLITCETMSGWGITTYKTLRDQWKYSPRGLRLAVYKRSSSPLQIIGTRAEICPIPTIRDYITHGKGGIILSLYTSGGDYTFTNAHLPFDSSSLYTNRSDSLLWQSTCFEHYLEKTRSTNNIWFYLGDFNFRVQYPDAGEFAEIVKGTTDYTPLHENYDELTIMLRYPHLAGVCEGIDRQGPQFPPTCKLSHGRKGLEYKCGKNNQRTPSWCDRILYPAKKSIVCTEYDGIDVGAMNGSDHASVIATFTIMPEI